MTGGAATSVLVVGAGPVGLALAAELGRMGVDCLLVEKRDGVLSVPKMSQVSARGMEFCRRWGIAAAVRGAVWSENHPLDFVYMRSLRGAELGRLGISSYAARGRLDFSPEGACHCPQIYFDPILAAHVKTRPGVRLRYNIGLESFRESADGVEATLRDSLTGATEVVTARYLIGCDGAGGMVRDALGINLDGAGVVAQSINIFFRAAALAGLHDKGWARFYRAIDGVGCWSELIPIDGKDLWRLTVFDGALETTSAADYLRRAAGFDFPHEILSAQQWERRDFVAESYGRGRVFIAGDAAHQCSPTGGLGMHTGMEEAVNLAWKIAAVEAGWGGARLLESYDAERRPVARRNVTLATGAFRTIAAIPGVDVVRAPHDNQGDGAVSAYLKDRMQTFSVSDREKQDYVYDGSPICAGAATGGRAPHIWLDEATSVLDLFGDGFRLLRFGGDASAGDALVAAAARRDVPLAVTVVADESAAGLYGAPLVLVRPDGHIGWRGDSCPADSLALIDRLRGA